MDFENADNKSRINIDQVRTLINKMYYVLKFSEKNPWYDREFIKKCYDLVEKGYTLNPYQVLRIENAFDMVDAIEEKCEEKDLQQSKLMGLIDEN